MCACASTLPPPTFEIRNSKIEIRKTKFEDHSDFRFSNFDFRVSIRELPPFLARLAAKSKLDAIFEFRSSSFGFHARWRRAS